MTPRKPGCDLPSAAGWVVLVLAAAMGCGSGYHLVGDGSDVDDAGGHDEDAGTESEDGDGFPDGGEADADAGEGGGDHAGEVPDGEDGADTGEVADAGPCLTAPPVPVPVSPLPGSTTGSIHAPGWAGVLRPLLRWTPGAASCGVLLYDIVIDDSCDPLDFGGCRFPSPEVFAVDLGETSFRPEADLPVSDTPPVGRRYFWRVRAHNEHGWSAWSRTRHLDVGRLPDDFDGDGYSELLVGCPGGYIGDGAGEPWSPTNRGKVLLFYGGPTGIDPGDRTEHGLPGPTNCLTGLGPPSVCRLAHGMLLSGDREGDGFADALLASAVLPGGAELDRFYVVSGRAERPPTEPTPAWTAFWYSAESTPERLVAGDLDLDGRPELGVLPNFDVFLPDYPPAAGDFFLVFGDPSMPIRPFHRPDDLVFDPPGARGGFNGLWSGDLDTDGRLDLLVGCSQCTTSDGQGSVLYAPGRDGGWLERDVIRFDNPDPADITGLFYIVALGDFDGDGRSEAASWGYRPGSPWADDHEVRVFRIDRSGIATLQAIPPSGSPDRSGFAVGALAAGDFDRDGFDDLALLLTDMEEYRVRLYAGGPGGLGDTPVAAWPLRQVPSEWGGFHRLAVTMDTNGDGYPELAVVGTPEPEGDPAVTLLHGGPALSAMEPTIRIDLPQERDRPYGVL